MTLFKNQLKHWMTTHRPNGEKNIFIFSTARSGTTWLAEMIATQGAFKIVNEPFNLRIDVVRERSGLNTWEDIFQPDNKDKIIQYLRNFEGKDTDLRFKRETPFSEFWHPVTKRIIYKILFAGEDDVQALAEALNGEVILLLRHPIPVALSREECPRLQSFLSEPFASHFSEEQLAYARQIVSSGNAFQIAVLDWCLQNALPLRQVKPNWRVVSYEQLVVEPQVVIANLANAFGFTEPSKMLERLYKASGSTTKSNLESKQVLLDPQKMENNRLWLIEKWKSKVSEDQKAQAFDTLKVFGIDYYVPDSYLPAERYLLTDPTLQNRQTL